MTNNNDLADRKAALSDAKRALLLKRLHGQQQEKTQDKAILPQSQSGPLPLSYTQQRIYFLEQLFPGSSAYHIHEAYRVSGPLDLAALKRALNEVARRQASLRTTFMTAESEPVQIIAAEVALPLPLTDISHLPPAAREEELLRLVLSEGKQTFDLQTGPLLRLSAVRLDEEDHALLLTQHHIISDEWSNDIFWRELNDCYRRNQQSAPANLPPLPAQYSDYAHWQRDQLSSGALDQQMNYWQEKLRGDLPLIQLPFDRPRPAAQSLRGGLLRRTLPDTLLTALQELSQQAGATLYMTLLAAFQTLLYRYSGQEEILVGTPIANRQRPETVDIIGMFINTAVIRSNLIGNPTFRQLLAQVRQTALDALANQDLPFDLLVQAMHPDRDMSYNPLFQTMFVYRSDSVERTLPGLEFARIQVDHHVSKFDLTLFAGEKHGRLYAALEYNDDLFDRSTVERMLDHWQTLLQGIVTDPETPIESLPLLAGAERELVVNMWNETDAPRHKTRCLHELISAHAQRSPQDTAVIDGSARLTYGELDVRANQLAHKLLHHGVTPSTPVALYSDRSAEMLVGILGILKAGAGYLPLEPNYPGERIAFALQDTDAPLLVTRSHLLDRLPPADAKIILLDADQAGEDWPDTPPNTAVSLDDLAYIIYTSGSTGTPKGVMVTHRNLLASTAARWDYYAKPVQRFLLLSSFAFDSSVAGIFWTLSSGGALVLPAPGDEMDVQQLAAIVAREQVTHTLALPGLYRLLLSYAPGHSLDTLQVVIVAGEACPPDLGGMHYARLPQSTLYNEYGPTEATVWCSVYQLPADGANAPVPIGRPIANSRLYILDRRRQPVPIGVPGELYIGGAGVSSGYWNNPSLTADRFPMLAVTGHPQTSPVYRTGDLARWRADGQVEYIGRVDSQVNIRGFRIEPGEIEAMLLRHPSIQEATVTAWDRAANRTGNGKILIAYIAREATIGEASVDSPSLSDYLTARLPDYMVPRHFVFLPALPRTPNGKIDHKQLPSPLPDKARQHRMVSPGSETEQALAQIWAEVLDMPAVSIDDNFFQMGGDSLNAIQLFSLINQRMGLKRPITLLFRHQTVAQMAAAIDTDTGSLPDDPILLPINQNGERPPFFYAHGIFGDVSSFTNIAPLLGDDQPLYGLQSLGLHPGREPDLTIEQMAAHYVAAMRHIQPSGPYHVGGFCFGGVMAYEIARQLEEQGEKTALLAIIESSAPRKFHDIKPLYHPQRLQIVRDNFPVLSNGYRQYGGQFVKERIKSSFGLVSRSQASAADLDGSDVEHDNLADFNASRPAAHFKLQEINKRAVQAYRPRPYGGQVTLFRARFLRTAHALYGKIDPQRGWGSLAQGGVTIRYVDGEHISILQPLYASILAAALTQALKEASR